MPFMSDSFAELFEQSQIENKMRPGTIISAKVLDIRNDTVVVNAGLKSEGIIPIDQFFNDEGQLEIADGDDVDEVIETFLSIMTAYDQQSFAARLTF